MPDATFLKISGAKLEYLLMNQMDIFYPDQSFYPTALDTIDPPSGLCFAIGDFFLLYHLLKTLTFIQ